jgi:hypothetical protein
LRIIINQTQSNSSVSFFEAPVPLKIFGNGGEEVDIVLDNSFNGQEFIEAISFDIGLIVFDPDRHLISKNNTVVLGVAENTIANNLIIYPNPSLGEFHITQPASVEIDSIKIYSVMGKLVKEQPYSETINISEMSSGLYYVYFETNYGEIHKTLLKQ